MRTRVLRYLLLVLAVGVWLLPWPLLLKVSITVPMIVILVLRARKPTAPPSIEELRAKSIAADSPEQHVLFELVMMHVMEPILTVETRKEIQGHQMTLVDLRTGIEAECCELFPFDVRIRTGYSLGPLYGWGHQVSLVQHEEGGWEIVETQSWKS